MIRQSWREDVGKSRSSLRDGWKHKGDRKKSGKQEGDGKSQVTERPDITLGKEKGTEGG